MNATLMCEELNRLGHQEAEEQSVGGNLTAVVVPMPLHRRYVLWSDDSEEPLEFVVTSEPQVVAFAMAAWRHGHSVTPPRPCRVVQVPDGTTAWHSEGHGVVDAVRPDGAAFRGGPVEWQSLAAAVRETVARRSGGLATLPPRR
jgi:hypothetical protein